LVSKIIFLILSFLLADGDLGAYGDAKAAFFKQKHRMLWERRHGEVGSGMKAEGDN
jgi:NADH-ubiquinone oxidoreductase subunit 10